MQKAQLPMQVSKNIFLESSRRILIYLFVILESHLLQHDLAQVLSHARRVGIVFGEHRRLSMHNCAV